MMTQRENLMHVLRRTGMAQWVPVARDCYDTLIPSAVFERPKGENGLDWFGCEWHFDKATMGYSQDPRTPPVCNDITKWREQVKFPNLDEIDWEAAAEQDEKRLDRENRALRVLLESGPWERLHALLGFENAFIAMYEEPEAFLELMQAITNHRIRLTQKLHQYYKPDIYFNMEDLGSQGGPLMSKEMYRTFIKPFQKQLVDECHRLGAIHEQHSCGKMDSFVEDMIDLQLDVLQPIQSMNDLPHLAATYSDKISFEGGISQKTNFSDTPEEELRAEARYLIDLFGPQKNFIFMCNSVFMRNSEIMLDEARKYGGYMDMCSNTL